MALQFNVHALVFCSIAILNFRPGYTQNGDHLAAPVEYQKSFWVEVGFGPAISEGVIGLAMLNAELIRDWTLAIGTTGLITDISLFTTNDYKESSSTDIMLGRLMKFERVIASFSGGPSFVRLTEYTYAGSFIFPIHEEKTTYDTGLAILAKFSFGGNWSMLGISCLANFNSKFSFGGFVVTYSIGKILYKKRANQ